MRRRAIITFVAAACSAVTMLVAASGAAGAATTVVAAKTCGKLPGDGAYSFVRTRRVSCDWAQKVSLTANRKFCRRRDRCDYDALVAGRLYRGRVNARGWRCKMKVGWEFYRARCNRGNKRFVAKAAS